MREVIWVQMEQGNPTKASWDRDSLYGDVRRVEIPDLGEWIRHKMSLSTAEKKPVIPSQEDAMWWAVAEVGEAADALVQMKADWKRNNPDKHLQDDFEKEAGQAIMMIALAKHPDKWGFLTIIKKQLIKWGVPFILAGQEFHVD